MLATRTETSSTYQIILETIKAEKARKDIEGVGVASKKAEGAMGKMIGRMQQIVRTMIALTIFRVLIGWMRDFTSGIIGASAQLEMYNRQLVVLYRSAILAGKAMEFLKTYAIATPFILRDLLAGAVRLKAFAVDVTKYTRAVGDWAAAMNMTFEDMAVRFGKIVSGTKQTARLLATAGIQTEEFNKALRATGDRALALSSIIAKKFPDMAKEISLTFTGLLSNIKDIYLLLMAEVGQKLFSRLKTDVEAIHDWMRTIYEDSERLSGMSRTFLSIYETARQVILSLVWLTKVLATTIKYITMFGIAFEGIKLLVIYKMIRRLASAFEILSIRMAVTVLKPFRAARLAVSRFAQGFQLLGPAIGIAVYALVSIGLAISKMNRELEVAQGLLKKVEEGQFALDKIRKMGQPELEAQVDAFKESSGEMAKQVKIFTILGILIKQLSPLMNKLTSAREEDYYGLEATSKAMERQIALLKESNTETKSDTLTLQKLEMQLKELQLQFDAMQFPDLEFGLKNTTQVLARAVILEEQIVQAAKEGTLVWEDHFKLLQKIQKVREDALSNDLARISAQVEALQIPELRAKLTINTRDVKVSIADLEGRIIRLGTLGQLSLKKRVELLKQLIRLRKDLAGEEKDYWKENINTVRLLIEAEILGRKEGLNLITKLLKKEREEADLISNTVTGREKLSEVLKGILGIKSEIRDLDDEALDLQVQQIELQARKGLIVELQRLQLVESAYRARLDEIKAMDQFEGKERAILALENQILGIQDERRQFWSDLIDASTEAGEAMLDQITSMSDLISTITDRIQTAWEYDQSSLERRIEATKRQLAEEQGLIEPLTKQAQLEMQLADLESKRTTFTERLNKEMNDFLKTLIIAVGKATILATIMSTMKMGAEKGLGFQDIFKSALFSFIPGGSFLEKIFAQRGFSGYVNKPTMFVAGEKEPEYVNIVPKDRTRRPGIRQPVSPERTILIEFNVSGDVYYDQEFEDRVEQSLRKVAARIF